MHTEMFICCDGLSNDAESCTSALYRVRGFASVCQGLCFSLSRGQKASTKYSAQFTGDKKCYVHTGWLRNGLANGLVFNLMPLWSTGNIKCMYIKTARRPKPAHGKWRQWQSHSKITTSLTQFAIQPVTKQSQAASLCLINGVAFSFKSSWGCWYISKVKSTVPPNT